MTRSSASLLVLPVLLLVSGCNKIQKSLGCQTPYSPAAEVRDRTILVMGQSNALYFPMYGGTQAFTAALQSFAPGNITYIVCAQGGTTMRTHWQVGAPLYQDCMNKVGRQKIDLMIWWQGESEAQSTALDEVEDWAASFVSMARTVRMTTGNPNMPILYTRLGDLPWQLPLYKQMYTVQSNIVLENSRMIDLNGIPTDQLHYIVNDGYAVVARLFAKAYWTFLNPED